MLSLEQASEDNNKDITGEKQNAPRFADSVKDKDQQ